jgi:hypothetical protein
MEAIHRTSTEYQGHKDGDDKDREPSALPSICEGVTTTIRIYVNEEQFCLWFIFTCSTFDKINTDGFVWEEAILTETWPSSLKIKIEANFMFREVEVFLWFKQK